MGLWLFSLLTGQVCLSLSSQTSPGWGHQVDTPACRGRGLAFLEVLLACTRAHLSSVPLLGLDQCQQTNFLKAKFNFGSSWLESVGVHEAVCTRTGCWAAGAGLWWWGSTQGPQSTFLPTASAPWGESLPAWLQALPTACCSPASMDPPFPSMCGGCWAEEMGQQASQGLGTPGSTGFCWNCPPRACLSKLAAHVLLLLLASLARIKSFISHTA